MSHTVIQFNGHERLLAKVKGYLHAMDKLIQDGDQAMDLLIKALDVADDETKLKIVLLLGSMGSARAVWPLYRLMTDLNQNDTIRHAAASQLSLVGAMTKDHGALVDNLIADLGYHHAAVRAAAAFALGWEGNQRAVGPLVDALCDVDPEVQQAAVGALANIGDERLFDVLANAMWRSTKEQQRCILYHLSCFKSHHKEVIEICAHYLGQGDADLRYDALVVLDSVSGTQKPLHLYLQCLEDQDRRIREQALVYLAGADRGQLRRKNMDLCVLPLVQDASPVVRQAALRLLNHIGHGPVPV